MYNRVIQLCLLVFISVCKGQETCTRNNIPGECIYPAGCPFMMGVLRSTTLTTGQKKNMIDLYRCEGDKTCCPKENVSTSKPESTTPERNKPESNKPESNKQEIHKPETCTRNNIPGECIYPAGCPFMMGVLRSTTLTTGQKKNMIDLYRCEGDKTCCPKENVSTIKPESTTPENNKQEIHKPERCIGANNENGECIAVGKCSTVLDMVSYKCGNNSVCCPTLGNRFYFTEEPIQSDLLPDRKTCGKFTETRIYGGNDADIGEYPWAVLLQYYNKSNVAVYSCGGSLINKRYVLTAAHCILTSHLKLKLFSVRLGETDIDTVEDCNAYSCDKPPVDIPVSETIVHGGYTRGGPHDIALIRLAEEVQYSNFIRPVCLPTLGSEIYNQYVGLNTTVVGWGFRENYQMSNIKQKLIVPVVSTADCQTKFYRVTANEICAGGEEGQDSCEGDSGGGLVRHNDANWIVVGVVAHGLKNCGTPGYPGVYTRVGGYMDWIIRNMKL